MKLIKLTSTNDSGIIYINPEMIGHIYEVQEKSSFGSIDTPKHTRVGVISHNNGGFMVKESLEKILKLIEQQNQ